MECLKPYRRNGPARNALMLLTPRLYQHCQIDNVKSSNVLGLIYDPVAGWNTPPKALHGARKMLLVHQVGVVKVGEVIRYVYGESARGE